jgi:DNA-binding transcriptional regulator YdaS (Cro superfamily)
MMSINDIITVAGSLSKLAKIAGVDHSTVIWWRQHGDRVPTVDRAKRINEALNIPLHELRPDIWPAPASVAA